MDLSGRSELTGLAILVRDIRESAPDANWMMVGAMARDLLVVYGHGIRPNRATEDVDLAIAVDGWPEFDRYRKLLLGPGNFQETTRAVHRLNHRSGISVDLLPFGGVEDAGGVIRWPPNANPEMNVIGFEEALATSIEVVLPEDQQVSVVCLPVFVLLKLMAWSDRHRRRPNVDAGDLFLVLSNYVDCGNQDHLYDEHADLLDDPDFDYVLAGAVIAGRDLRSLLIEHSAEPGRVLDHAREILIGELAAEEASVLLQEAPNGEIERFHGLLSMFLRGLED